MGAFDLDQVLERRPTFLEPEYPFEWTGVYSVEAGTYELVLEEGPDPNMSIVIKSDQEGDDLSLKDGAEFCVRKYADDAELVSPGGPISFDSHFDLELSAKGKKSFLIEVDGQTNIGLFTQHTAEEFDMKLYRVDRKDSSSPIDPNVELSLIHI